MMAVQLKRWVIYSMSRLLLCLPRYLLSTPESLARATRPVLATSRIPAAPADHPCHAPALLGINDIFRHSFCACSVIDSKHRPSHRAWKLSGWCSSTDGP